jgi:hypothetical protein
MEKAGVSALEPHARHCVTGFTLCAFRKSEAEFSESSQDSVNKM